jgi:hypothetical protein
VALTILIGISEIVLQQLSAAEREDIWGATLNPGQFESHGNLTTDADATFLSVYQIQCRLL